MIGLFCGCVGDVSPSALDQNFLDRTLTIIHVTQVKMASVNSLKDVLCLFDVDGTITPARLVNFFQ